jgi:preprotein translocase subunit YajC
MTFAAVNLLFAFAPAAAPGTVADPKAQMLQMVGTFVFMGIVMYFLMFRPQQKKAKEHAVLLKTMKAGDRVITNGGIIGIVLSVKDKSVSIRSSDAKLEVLKSAVTEITEKSAVPAE